MMVQPEQYMERNAHSCHGVLSCGTWSDRASSVVLCHSTGCTPVNSWIQCPNMAILNTAEQ